MQSALCFVSAAEFNEFVLFQRQQQLSWWGGGRLIFTPTWRPRSVSRPTYKRVELSWLKA